MVDTIGRPNAKEESWVSELFGVALPSGDDEGSSTFGGSSRSSSAVEVLAYAEFDPSEHPRDDKGRFGHGGGDEVSEKYAAWGERAAEIAKAKTAPNGMHDEEVIRSAFEGTFAGLTTKVTDMPSREGSALRIEGEILKDGKSVGRFTRAVSVDGQTIFHIDLELRPSVQGRGFAREFNRNAENHYIANGVKQITLHADIDVGGYAWAKQGFDAKTPEDLRSLKTDMQGKLHYLADSGKLPGVDVDRVHGQIDVASTTWEIADIPDVGKTLMLGSAWMGAMSLAPGSPTSIVGEVAYQSKKETGK